MNKNEIARKLWVQYIDFEESKSDKMDLLLGEIYRDHLEKVYRVLKEAGIPLDEAVKYCGNI